MAVIGSLLRNTLARIESEAVPERRAVFTARFGGDAAGERLPVVLDLGVQRPYDKETWAEFRARVEAQLLPMQERLTPLLGDRSRPIYSANSLAGLVRPSQVGVLAEQESIKRIELDPRVRATLMDDAVVDVGLETFHLGTQNLRGSGVRVAVLDSGVDTQHPFLRVSDSVSTSGEDISLPGRHGTHCAGSIASQDMVFQGIAPDVTLLNIKVLDQDGGGFHTNVARGIDAALDRDAAVLSMSLGFNHLPAWSDGGHGWTCPDGACPLCRAVDNAVSFGAVVVVAAGNEHGRAEALRRFGYGGTFDIEQACPGHSRGAITIGALTKRTFLPADFSSRGPTAYGAPKPDISAPGVNIMSTVPAPRNPNGAMVANPPRHLLFARLSGTSMATPIVAGAVALLIEHHRRQGLPTDPASVRGALLSRAVTTMPFPPLEIGVGRLDLAAFTGSPVPAADEGVLSLKEEG